MTSDGAVLVVSLVFFTAIGAAFGSFANVCIHRLPRGESLVSPPSRCPSCGRPIAFYDNVPVLAWLWLRGRCRSCGARISARYPIVEAIVAALFLVGAVRYGVSIEAVAFGLLSVSSVILIVTDWEARILPDEITLGGIVLGLGLAALHDLTQRAPGVRFVPRHSAILDGIQGALLGAALLMVVRLGYQFFIGAEGMGLGDVKMIASIGSILGSLGVLVTLFFASAAGALVGFGAVVLRRLLWGRSLGALRRGALTPREAASRHGLLLDGDGRVLVSGRRFSEIPGAAPVGELFGKTSDTGRRIVAFLRLARRRARHGVSTESTRVSLDDGENFFRVLAAHGEPTPEGLLVLLSRSDVPFGIFLALGSLVAFLFGRALLTWLLGWVPPLWSKLLP